MGLEITAVIVARGGSVRIPSKSMQNLREGLSLIGNKINQLKSAGLINRVVLGSDNDEMLEEARKYGAEAIKRPDDFCNETKTNAREFYLSSSNKEIVILQKKAQTYFANNILQKPIGDFCGTFFSVLQFLPFTGAKKNI